MGEQVPFLAKTLPHLLPQKKNGLAEIPYLIVLNGAGTKSRTRDLLITNQFCNQGIMRSPDRFF